MPYEHRYKYGKQTELLELEEIISKVSRVKKKLTVEALAYFWLLFWCGVRKSEAYERTVQDCQVTEEFFVIDFHKRKKGGAQVPPLELPLWFPGVKEICEQLLKARKRKASRKLMERTHKGVRSTSYERAVWLFPNVHKTWALEIVKKILGKKYYPHFLRLERISIISSDPQANIARIKSFTGIKTIPVIEQYLGTSKKEQKAAVDFMAQGIPKNLLEKKKRKSK